MYKQSELRNAKIQYYLILTCSKYKIKTNSKCDCTH